MRYLRWYLIWGSLFAISQGVLGFLGFSGPGPENSHFGANLYSDPIENIYHIAYGVVGFIIGLGHARKAQIIFGWVLGGTALILGVYGIFTPVPTGFNILGAQLQNPGDTLIHLIFGTFVAVLTIRAMREKPSRRR